MGNFVFFMDGLKPYVPSMEELVDNGYILPPKMILKTINEAEEDVNECQHIMDTIDEISVKKVLICARSTKQIVSLIALSKFVHANACKVSKSSFSMEIP